MDLDADSAQLWARVLRLTDNDLDSDQDEIGQLIHVLNRRGEPDVISWALPELSHVTTSRRLVAAWTLEQHGFLKGRPFAAQVMPSLITAGRLEQDDGARTAMVQAIGSADDPRWVDELISYAADSCASVREAVASSLPMMFAGEQMHQRALDTLITLTGDPDPHVRDWATMSLGSQTEQDSEAIRDALVARLDDTGDDDTGDNDTGDNDTDTVDTADEAALGLALRADPRVHRYLEQRLDADTVGCLVVEAAGALGDPRLLPALRRLRSAGWQLTARRPSVIDDAISALEARAGAAPPSRYSTQLSRSIRAPRPRVYAALLDPDAVAAWRVPAGMRSEVHEFDPREGGRFRVSLTYDSPDAVGKSASHTDTYHGRFVRLIPDEQVVEEFEFEDAAVELQGTMTMTTTLADRRGGTEVVIRHDGIPGGLSPADNETGTRMALDNLARLFEGS